MTQLRVVLATEPGTPGQPNEDFAAVAPGAAVLLDGVTNRSPDIGCRHGVAWYARTLGGTLLTAITASPPVPLADALADAIAEVRRQHGGGCDLASPATPGATVVAARAQPGGISYLVLSDSSIVADYGDGRAPLVVTDIHRPAAADPAVAATASTGTIDMAGLRGLALLSDGATRITDRFGLLGWPELMDVLRTAGPAELISQVRQAEGSDPAGERWPRVKLTDDATALWWPLSG
jgi:Protein phosphatase 2C